MQRLHVLGALAIALLACAGTQTATSPPMGLVTTCESLGKARPVCKFQNPEDLVVLPGDEAILVSEYGAMQGGKAGSLSLLSVATEEKKPLFRGGDAKGQTALWGDAACPGPPGPEFSPHGIHLAKRSDGALQLLAVQHGGRESVEFFEVLGAGMNAHVVWRGCALAPEDAWLNSVAALPEGGFLTTHMLPRSAGFEALVDSFTDPESVLGNVYEWQPDHGYSVMPNTKTLLPNGIEVSPDGTKIFLNASGAGEVWRMNRSTGEIEARAAVPSLDNARWAPDGRLLVASLLSDTADFAICTNLESGACPLEFQIVAVDPETMETEVLYRGGGPPKGAGTVGLQVGNELFIGSFAGDRVLRVALDGR